MQTIPTPATEDPNRSLERACIEEYLRSRGHTLESVARLPADAAKRIMASAASAATQRLTEIECRAHWTRSIHHQ
jgi:hypothetical protein